MDCHFRDLPDFPSFEHDDKLLANPEKKKKCFQPNLMILALLK